MVINVLLAQVSTPAVKGLPIQTVLILALLIVGLAIGVALDARKRGENPVGGFILTLLTGPIGWLIYYLTVGRSGSAMLRRTVLIPATLDTVYRKCFQWFGLQGYDIAEQMKNQKLVGESSGWRLTLTFNTTDEGTYVVAQGTRRRAMEQFSQLLGILSMLEEKPGVQQERSGDK
jgi:hypothetical protein